MTHEHEHYHRPERQPSFWKTPTGTVAIFFCAAVGYFLITEHWAHIVPWLPWLIILLCPLMHMFMHGGHGGHGGHGEHGEHGRHEERDARNDRNEGGNSHGT